MQRARLPVTGDLIEYRWYNRGAADVTLVLLHEGLGCTAMWKQFPQRVAALTACPVFVYSRAGYGGSSAIELPRPIDFHTSEAVTKLPALLDAAGIGACILIGHSDGATIALVHAGRSSDPRLLGVLAMAPHVRTEAKTLETIAQAARSFRAGELRRRLARYHGENVDCAFWGWARTWLDPRFVDWTVEADLAGVGVPVLALRGADDPYNTDVHCERIRRLVPAWARCVTLPECGHAPHSEQAETTLRLVRAFVSLCRREAAARRQASFRASRLP